MHLIMEQQLLSLLAPQVEHGEEEVIKLLRRIL
jgi:hypothetical protein